MDELWRGRTERSTDYRTRKFSESYFPGAYVDAESGTEVAVVRVDSLPTRDQVRRAISQAGYSPEYAYRRARGRIDRMTDAVMFLFGQTEGETP